MSSDPSASGRPISRRRAVGSLLGLVAACGLARHLARTPSGEPPAAAAVARRLCTLADPGLQSGRPFGRAPIAPTGTATLIDAAAGCGEARWSMLMQMSDAQLRRRMRERIEADYRSGSLVYWGGWRISTAEASLLELSARHFGRT